jgi:mono/diheme cytochrome c family protein
VRIRCALLALVALATARSARADRIDAATVLDTYCSRCHAAKAEGDFGFLRDTARLVAEGLVVPGDAERSPLYRRVADGEMPPAGAKARPTREQIAALAAWIDGLPTARVAFRSERELARLLAADHARLSATARPHARWLTLTHLANAGVPERQLDRYRVALAKLLASLTWAPIARAPIAVDPERTVFRIDLRELGWAEASWDALRAAYPYGVARGGDVPDAIRGDWLVATASRPPFYHQLLGLPATEGELARRLGIDLADDIARGRVVRAGFARSGVSVHNRMIERHATRHGALWRSYDFASSTGREDIFSHPIDFVAAGGELIFNLPNGMQAYLLVDAAGRRIDKAPTAIVSDPRRPDRAVENGVSCMGCHAAGILPKADQLRDAIAPRLSDRDAELVRRLHPPAATLDAHYDRDRARFAAALAAIGEQIGDPADEPIALLVGRYEAELDLALAAAELGLRSEQLRAQLGRGRVLGALASGGTIKRDTWAQLFPRLLGELGVGVAFTPQPGRGDTLPVWIDRDGTVWLALEVTTDQASATRLCAARGLALPRANQLTAAIDRGLAAALAIQQPMWTAGTRLDASGLRHASVLDPVTSRTRRADVLASHAIVCKGDGV